VPLSATPALLPVHHAEAATTKVASQADHRDGDRRLLESCNWTPHRWRVGIHQQITEKTADEFKLVAFLETSHSNAATRKFWSSQKEESRAQSADSLKAYSQPRAYNAQNHTFRK